MTTDIHFECTRENESGKPPPKFSCGLILTDDALIGSSGTWKLVGPSPDRIFVAQSGKWLQTAGQITLDSDPEVLAKRFVLKNPDAPSGTFVGDGLVGGNLVSWRRL